MTRTVWAQVEGARRLYLIDEDYEFIQPVKKYLDHLNAIERSPNTQTNYCYHLQYLFTFLDQSHLDWRDVKPDDLVEFVQWLRNPLRQIGVQPLRSQSPLTERSVNTIIAAVNSFYRYHIQRGEVLKNPVVMEQISNRFSGFKPFLVHTSRGKTKSRALKLKEPKKRIRVVKDEDFEKFLNSSLNLQFKCIALLMREGGLRSGEVLGLLIQDIEFHENGVWIRRRNVLENLALAKSMAEGEERFVDLPPSVMALLDRLLLQHTFNTDHLFVVLKKNAVNKEGESTYGHPLDHEALKSMFRHYSQKSGVSINPHKLRHTHASELIRAGWDAALVQKRLGHAQVQTTINTYVHLDDEDLSKKWREYQEMKTNGSARKNTTVTRRNPTSTDM